MSQTELSLPTIPASDLLRRLVRVPSKSGSAIGLRMSDRIGEGYFMEWQHRHDRSWGCLVDMGFDLWLFRDIREISNRGDFSRQTTKRTYYGSWREATSALLLKGPKGQMLDMSVITIASEGA